MTDHGYQSEDDFRKEIIGALKTCEITDPYDELDVDAAARYLYEDQYVNAPDDFWDVVRRYRRQRLREKHLTAAAPESTEN